MNIGLIISPLLSFTGNVARVLQRRYKLKFFFHSFMFFRLIMWFMNM